MGQAERALRRARREAAKASTKAAQTAEAEESRARRAFVAEVSQLTPPALDALRRAGWPTARLIRLEVMRRELAGCQVGHFVHSDQEGNARASRTPIFLLSDGRWSTGDGGGYFRSRAVNLYELIEKNEKFGRNAPLDPVMPEGIPQALRAIISRYGEAS